MTDPSTQGMAAKWMARSAPWSLALRVCILAAVTVGAWAAAAAWKYASVGPAGVWAATVAAGICFVGPLISLVLIAKLRAPQWAVSAVLLGMLVRLGLPLAAAMYYQQQGGPLREAGVIGCILAIYLVTLCTSVVLEASLIQKDERQRRRI